MPTTHWALIPWHGLCYCEENQKGLNLLTQYSYTSDWLCQSRKWCMLCYVFLTVTINRGCLISWLLTFFFKSQNISFLNSCCPFPVLCSLEDLGWGSTFANITVLQRAGRASCNWMRKIEVLCELKTLCRHCAFNQMFNFTVRIESHNHLVNFAISL